jgi:hypothetical protein
MQKSMYLFPVMIFLMWLVIAGCKKEQPERIISSGLIGTWYGDADFSNIKEPEVLSGLEGHWDDETGHGNSWAGRWQGMIIGPVTGKVTFRLLTLKYAELQVADKKVVLSDPQGEADVSVDMEEGKALPIEVAYAHTGGGEGSLVIEWQWEDRLPESIPTEALYFTESQALAWNYIPEPDPAEVDTTKFRKVPAQHIIVYHEKGRFGGWPANNGIWIWENDEILVGFIRGYYQANDWHHSIDETRPSLSVLARSMDGGYTWALEDPENFVGDDVSVKTLKGRINYGHPNFVLRNAGEHFYFSYDRGRSWQGVYNYPDFGLEDLTSRTDYLINGPEDCLIFMSAEDERVEARMQDRTFCARTTDGGQTFSLISWIGEPETVRAVMPSSARISETRLITALRRRHDDKFPDKPKLQHNWIDVYESRDNGQSWHFLSKVAETDMHKRNGNPPSLVRLRDGRICVTYGYRAVPYGIRARISEDNGKSWGGEIHLRDDAKTWDIGYTRSVQRQDGKIVTIYYYSTDRIPEQHIAATVWSAEQE